MDVRSRDYQNFLVSILWSAWRRGQLDIFIDCSLSWSLFFGKIVEIERFALRAAVLVPNVPSLVLGDPDDLTEK